jgi:hypothetical protein
VALHLQLGSIGKVMLLDDGFPPIRLQPPAGLAMSAPATCIITILSFLYDRLYSPILLAFTCPDIHSVKDVKTCTMADDTPDSRDMSQWAIVKRTATTGLLLSADQEISQDGT